MYPVFIEDIGTLTTQKVSSTKLTFNPSTGQLNATEVNTTSDISAKMNIRQIDSALEIIDIKLLDHFIIGKGEIVSCHWYYDSSPNRAQTIRKIACD